MGEECGAVFSQPAVAETRMILCSPTGKTITRGKPMISPSSKDILIDRRKSSLYLTATRMEHLSTGCMKKPLNENEDTNFIPSTVYVDC